jgi:caspase 7
MNHSDSDCFLLAMMSHGDIDGKIHAYDGEYLAEELWENFIGTNCETLVGKPKLFFIQVLV